MAQARLRTLDALDEQQRSPPRRRKPDEETETSQQNTGTWRRTGTGRVLAGAREWSILSRDGSYPYLSHWTCAARAARKYF